MGTEETLGEAPGCPHVNGFSRDGACLRHYRSRGNLEKDKLNPTVERTLKRVLKTLVDRADVVIVGGKGGVAI